MKPLEEEAYKRWGEQVLTYIDITTEMKEDAERFLKHSGVNYFTLFPDLDGLAKYVNSPLKHQVTSRSVEGLRFLQELDHKE